MANFTKCHCKMMKQQYGKFFYNVFWCIKLFNQRQLRGLIISASSLKKYIKKRSLAMGLPKLFRACTPRAT